VGWWRRQVRAFRTLHEFAFCLTERYERLETERDFRIEVENEEIWKRATAGGRGAIVVTGHVGNWELGATLPGTIEGRHVHLVREEEIDPRAQAMIAALLRDRLGAHVTMHFAGDDPALALRLREALEQGEIVALQADRRRSGGRSVGDRIFGHPFDLPLGPLVLARISGASLVPAFMFREARRSYRICLREPISVSSAGDRESDLAAAARQLAGEIEYAIRRRPHQWFCWRRVWPDRGDD
jgi:KDO2-lipid IV(A) lauroyltransferase